MQYVRLGNAGISVSRLSIGCMDFPMRFEKSEAQEVLDAAIHQGINLLDTADAYRGSEEALAPLIKGKRDKLLLATKFWVNHDKRPNGGGCSRVHIIRALEESLQKLETDYVDLYQLHHPDDKTPVEETLSTLDTLVKQGKIRYIGVSNHYAWQMAHMLGVSALHNWEPLVSVQCRYNILDRPVEVEILPFCRRFNVGTLIYSPLNWGALTGKFKRGEAPPKSARLSRSPTYEKKMTDEVFDILDKLGEIAAKYEIGMNQLAIAWLLSKQVVSTVVLGGTKREHFEQLYGACELHVDAADIKLIDEISDARKYIPFHNQAVVGGSPVAMNWW